MTDDPPISKRRPDRLPPGEHWTNPCPACGPPTLIQGGNAGLRDHYKTVHPDRVAPQNPPPHPDTG